MTGKREFAMATLFKMESPVELITTTKSPGGESIPQFCRAERPSQHTDKKNISDKKKDTVMLW